jgi:hypothetical protein
MPSSNSNDRAVGRFTSRIVPMVLRNGQGHDNVTLDGVSFEVAWFRQSEHEWNVWLAVETDRRRVEAPQDTTFRCEPGHVPADHEAALASQLSVHLTDMLAAA